MVYLDPDEKEVVDRIIVNDAAITIDGKSGGRDIQIKTQGSIVLKSLRKPEERNYYYSDKYMPKPLEYTLEADLTYNGEHVYTLQVFPIKVTRTATAAYGSDIDVLIWRQKLGVPKDGYTVKINKAKTQVTFTWEEEVN